MFCMTKKEQKQNTGTSAVFFFKFRLYVPDKNIDNRHKLKKDL